MSQKDIGWGLSCTAVHLSDNEGIVVCLYELIIALCLCLFFVQVLSILILRQR